MTREGADVVLIFFLRLYLAEWELEFVIGEILLKLYLVLSICIKKFAQSEITLLYNVWMLHCSAETPWIFLMGNFWEASC